MTSNQTRTPDPGNNRQVLYTTLCEGMLEDYIQRHNEIPSEVVEGLRTAGVQILSLNHLPGTNVLVLTFDTAGSNLEEKNMQRVGGGYGIKLSQRVDGNERNP